MKIKLIFLLLLLHLGGTAQTIDITDLSQKIAIGNRVQYCVDSSSVSTYFEAKACTTFKPISSDVPNFGISDKAYWLKLKLMNRTSRRVFLLQVSQPGLDEVDMYYPFSKDSVVEVHCGEYLPFNNRIFFDANYIFRITLPRDTTQEIYIRVKARDNIQVPMFLGTTERIFETNKIKDTLAGIYIGIMMVMLFYNLFLYFSVRDKSYLYYVIYIATVILTQASIQGYTFQYLYPNIPFLAQYSSFILPPMVGIAGLYFLRNFLSAPSYFPKLANVQHVFTGGYILAVFLSALGMFSASFLLIEICAAGVSVYMIVLAYLIHKKGRRDAKFFLVAWTFFLLGVSVYVMKDLGVLPYNNFTFYSMPMGSAIEVVLLSFALADRINVLKKEKELSQAQTVNALKENEKLIREQNAMLELKVHERTMELEDANEEIRATLNHLKETQAQLVDAEKMASLGQLTAGIAHEINNPINYVGNNVRPLKMDISDLIELLEKYKTLENATDFEANIEEIRIFSEQIDYTYLKSEIDILLSGIEDGAHRTAEIVKGLRNFSRLDESDLKSANINEGLSSTLILLSGEVPANCEIIKEFGDIPNIDCLPGKINQVFMNLLNNALYAIKKKPKNEKQFLKITTNEHDSETVSVIIEDTGIGMSPETKARIFEPFFTTKDVGEGTGLGMSIVFKIIETHQAIIEVESQLGVGTKFTILFKKKLSMV